MWEGTLGSHEPPQFALQHRASTMQTNFETKSPNFFLREMDNVNYELNSIWFVESFDLSDTFLKHYL